MRLCVERGISPTQMCKETGISTGMPTRWKQGFEPSSRSIARIAQYFNIDPEYFAGDGNYEKCEFWETYKELCAKKGVSPSGAAKEMGFSSGMVAFWKQGRTPRADTLKKISLYFNVPPEYLLGKEERKDPRKESSPFSSVSVVAYPIIGRVRAGYGMEPVEENSDEITYIPSNLIRGHAQGDFFCLRVVGDSMQPKFAPGDIVLVERATSVDSGTLAVVLYDGEDATIKKVRYMPGQDWIELIPENPKYKTLHLEGAQLSDCKVLGKVKMRMTMY